MQHVTQKIRVDHKFAVIEMKYFNQFIFYADILMNSNSFSARVDGPPLASGSSHTYSQFKINVIIPLIVLLCKELLPQGLTTSPPVYIR